MSSNELPRARHENLQIQALGEELLVFDLVNETAHALNGPAAFVWQHADGTRTIEQIASGMTVQFGAPADAQAVWYALAQLHARHLLETPTILPARARGLTRRQFLARAAAGAVLLAVVTSILLPSPAHAQSSACLPENANCFNILTPCCPGLECVAAVAAICTSPPPP